VKTKGNAATSNRGIFDLNNQRKLTVYFTAKRKPTVCFTWLPPPAAAVVSVAVVASVLLKSLLIALQKSLAVSLPKLASIAVRRVERS